MENGIPLRDSLVPRTRAKVGSVVAEEDLHSQRHRPIQKVVSIAVGVLALF